MSSQNRKYSGENPDGVSKISRGARGERNSPVPGPSSQALGGTPDGHSSQNMAFRDFLLKLSREITEKDLEEMKFRLQGRGIGSGVIEKCSESMLLFDLLEKGGHLSMKDTVILRQLCRDNVKLLQILNNYERGDDCYTEGPFNKIQKELREGYVDRLSKIHPFPWCPWREIDLDHAYTNLRVIPGIKHRLAVTSQKHAQAMGIPSSPSYSSDVGNGGQFNCTEDVVNFLWKDPSHKVAFVQGGPGIGKSTFCRRMVHLWAENKLTIPEREFDLVIILEGRNFSGDLKHCIFQQLFPQDFLDEDTVYNCVQKYASNCLIIIDGVDELSDRGKTTALQLARGKLLRGVTLLLAGRPEATKDFMQYVNRHLEVQGFSYRNAVSYIRKYFGSRHTEKRDKLLLTISENGNVRVLTANPFTTLQLCLIAETGDVEMFSETDQIMEEVVTIMCTQYVSNLTSHNENEDKASGNVTTEQCGRDCNVTVDELIRAAKLVAYFGMKMDTLVFDEKKLENVLLEKPIREHLLKSGVLSRDFTLAKLDTRRTCWFPHKLIQDVLCVSYLATLSPDDLRRELDNPACVKGLSSYGYTPDIWGFDSGYLKRSENLIHKIVDDEPRFRVMLAHIIQHRDMSSFSNALWSVTDDKVKNVLGEAVVNNYKFYCAIDPQPSDYCYIIYCRDILADILPKMTLPPVLTFTHLYDVSIEYHNDGFTYFRGRSFSSVQEQIRLQYMYKLPHPTYMVTPPVPLGESSDENSDKNSFLFEIIPWVNYLSLNDVEGPALHQVRTLCIVWAPPACTLDEFDYEGLPGLRDWLSRARTNTTLFLVVPRRYHDDYFHLRALDFVKSCRFEHVTVKLCCNRAFHPSEELLKYAENGWLTVPVYEFRTSLHQLYYDKLSPY